MKYILILSQFIFLMAVTCTYAQLPGSSLLFNECQVGNPVLKGSYEYYSNGQKFILNGSGENIWFDRDQFYFLWKEATGDFIIQSRIEFIGEGNHEHRKIGLMMRESVDPGSPHYSAVVHGDGLTSLQFRVSQGAQTSETKAEIQMPGIIQLERKGKVVTFSYAREGDEFKSISYTADFLKERYLIGLFLCSHDTNTVESAIFDNVRFTFPATPELIPYRDYLGSHIEILDITTGTREIVYSSKKSLQAPEWTNDGNFLVYNSEGKLYALDLSTRTSVVLNTGFANRNNNDHVRSFDDKWQGISHHSENDGGVSMIYILPSNGGIPVKITQKGPSYLHGWSPDGKFLTYTGGREDNYDIFTISIEDKKEIRLTDSPGLDDGSEFTPDGRFIYFNSARTGTMQIWRMKPNGEDQEQVTNDEFNNWFPHISPNGKEMVFISYSLDIPAEDHPFYKPVYLRKMPVDGGSAEVLVALYGGQGTINVNSWSPDGKKIAFVSNTGFPSEF